MEPNQPQQKSNGALIGSIIIIIILILGGIYFWQTSVKEKTIPENSNVGQNSNDANLDANINSVDLDNLDNGI